ncbi:MAG: translation initiation factor IF-2 [Candidatus Kariarchaeaceae archaeon]|jgi:translation initiation factor 5B
MSQVSEGPEGSRVRAPIAVIMGHVDSGKTSLLDRVRKTVVQAREAGGITQHIGASLFPKETIIEISKKLHKGNLNMKTPGILIIDTPGHAAFMSLRTRGASIADIAILVVDLTKGFQAQTYESIETLKRSKVPFVVAANKMDRVGGWEAHNEEPFVVSYKMQNSVIKQRLDNEIYQIMGELSQLKIEADRYDNIKDFTKKVAIVPTSATTGEGITDLFMVIAGLTQQYMMKKLTYADGPGQGVILEVKEEVGMGMTINVILYHGHISKRDTIVIAGKKGPIKTTMRSLIQPKPLDEMRDQRERGENPDIIYAAAGMKISGPNLEDAISGGALYVAENETHAAQLMKQVKDELSSVQIQTDDEGIMVKADTLGSLEALITLMKEKGVPIRSADVGDITRRDVIDASITAKRTPEYGAILAFNVKPKDDAEEVAFTEGVQIFSDPIIYQMIDQYIDWMGTLQKEAQADTLAELPMPTKITHIPEYVFKRSKPMVIGVRVESGKLRTHDVLINADNERVGTIHQIKYQNDFIKEAEKGMEVSVAIRGPTYGRQVKEGDTLYVDIRTSHAYTIMTKYINDIEEADKLTLTEIEKIKKASGLKFWPFTNA